ncbi:rhomboid protease ROM6, putative [Hepatocystis sp. ex Piliocolobus tephrosceles]|nr:rhomboid protease ROM6, putative [Hepatocystis sp. ex Piliocolobus tephrosceles]
MFNFCWYLRTNCYKRNISHIINKRRFHQFISKRGLQTVAIKRKDRIKRERKLNLREKIKLIIFSSIYFFACDYIYHVYILHNKTTENDKSENEKKNTTSLLNYIKSIIIPTNIQSKKNDVNINSTQQQKEKEGETKNIFNESVVKNNYRKENKSDNNRQCEKNEIKNCKTKEQDPYEIKINRITKKKEFENRGTKFSEKDTSQNNQLFGYDINKKNGNKKNENNEEKSLKTVITDSIYNNHLFNYCNLFMYANGIVFLCWRLSDLARNKKFYHFMCRHFICSYENIKKKYFHTILTAGISHMTFPHFLFNMWAFHTISNALLCPEIKQEKTNNYYNFFFTSKSSIVEKKINELSIINICLLSSAISTIPYVLIHKRNKILGASGSIMGLVFILSTLKPNETFISIFPLPYLKLTALQLCHISILTNVLFLFFKKNHFSVAWLAHLFGLAGGAIYNVYQRKKNNNFNYYPFIQLSVKNGYIDYLNSYYDFLDTLTYLKLRTKLFFSLDIKDMQKISSQIQNTKFLQSRRRLRLQSLKVKNLEAMSK